MKTHSLILTASGEVAVQEVDLPAPGPGQVQLAAQVTMISPGTERAWWLNLPNTASRFPRATGYNFVGRVVALGEGVDHFRENDRVAAAASHSAHVTTSVETVLPIPDEVSDEAAVFFHMGIFAMNGVRISRIELGEPVIVLGQGIIGQLAMQFSRANGGFPITAVDRAASRLEISRRCGADRVVAADDVEAMGALIEEGAPVVVEATGAPEPINTAIDMARYGGRVVLLASTRGETLVNFYQGVHMKGLTLHGAHSGARPQSESRPGSWSWRDDGTAVLDLMRGKRLDVLPLITDRLPAERAPEAYAQLKAWETGPLGVLLQWK